MKKIKVIHVITLLELGGAQQNTLFTVTNLNREKFEVGLICGEGGFLDEQAKQVKDLKIHFVKNMARPIRPFKDVLCIFQIMRILKKEKPDIIHTHSSKAGIVGRIAAALSGAPILIHSIHGFGFNPYQKIWVRKLFIFLEKRIAKFTDCFIAVSRENIRLGLSLGIGESGQYILIRSGVDIQKIKDQANETQTENLKRELNIAKDYKVILTVGPFKIQKDPLSFVELANKVKLRFDNVEFLMSGDGELRGAIEERIKTHHLENSVKLLGWRKDIPHLLKICDIFALTSLWEGLPRASVEALILGKPVAAFHVDGIPEVVKDGVNGFLFIPKHLDAMAEKIVQMLENEALLKNLSRNAANSIDQTFDIHFMVLEQEKLYASLLSRLSAA